MKVSNETKVGVLATVSIVLLVLGYNILRGNNTFGKDQIFYSEYANVEGLSTSSMVSFKGLVIGKVRGLRYNPESGKIRVEFSVNEDYKIPKGSVAKIAAGDLLGSKLIDMQYAKNNVYHESGDQLSSEIATSLTDEVEKQILPLKNKATQLMASLDSMIQVTEFILLGSRDDISRSMTNVSGAIASIRNSAEQLDTLIEAEAHTFHATLLNVEKISQNLMNNAGTISALLNNTAAITDSVKSSNLTKALNNAQVALQEFSEIAAKIENGEGNIGMLVNDTALYHRIVSSAASLDTFLLDPEVKVTFFGKTERQKARKRSKKKAQQGY